MNMKSLAWVVLIYGLLVLGGGLAGFAVAHSFASLVMGGIFSLATIASAALMFQGKRFGYFAAVALVSILTLFFGYRFFLTFKLFPPGVMCVVSLTVFALLARKQ